MYDSDEETSPLARHDALTTTTCTGTLDAFIEPCPWSGFIRGPRGFWFVQSRGDRRAHEALAPSLPLSSRSGGCVTCPHPAPAPHTHESAVPLVTRPVRVWGMTRRGGQGFFFEFLRRNDACARSRAKRGGERTVARGVGVVREGVPLVLSPPLFACQRTRSVGLDRAERLSKQVGLGIVHRPEDVAHNEPEHGSGVRGWSR